MSDFEATPTAAAHIDDRQPMKLTPIASCGGGTCPAIYRTTRGTFVIQGRAVPVEKTEINLGADELLVEIPESLIPSLASPMP